jgi:hypothetical protein
MASMIDKIEIQNFKFFPKMIKPIEVSGKHMLLYGENGSGKSSIYWALYTLLEAANKENDREIKKYFDSKDDERLLNINIEQGQPETPESYLKIKFLNETEEFNLSFNDTAIRGNIDAQKSNLASDFINYRHLLNLYNFSHSEEIDIFQFFTYAVLPYVKFKPITYWYKNIDGSIVQNTTESANKIYEFVRKGPLKNKKTKQGKNRYPQAKEQEYKDYENTYNALNSGLYELITYINTEGNPILQDNIDGLGYNLKFKLILDKNRLLKEDRAHLNVDNRQITEIQFKNTNPAIKESDFLKNNFYISEQKFIRPKFHIWLKIEEYEGKTDVVKRAHSFLNEAKLTAVALAIRLAILKKRFEQDDSKLKLLVFDDLMISLDMSNREKIINLILNKFISQYQVFILTHDKVMFEDAKRHIEAHHTSVARKRGESDDEIKNETDKNWVFYEMYQAANDKFSFPYITEHTTSIQKAFFYFKEQIDFNACGNNLRTALEEFFYKFIPHGDLDGNTMLQGMNIKAIKYFEKVGLPIDNLEKIDRYIKRSLNPTSHYNPQANYYRKELEDIFQIYLSLNQLKNDPLVSVNSLLLFDILTKDGVKYTYTVKLLDDIRAYNKNDGLASYLVEDDSRKYGYVSILTHGGSLLELKDDTPQYTLSELYQSALEAVSTKMHKEPIIESSILDIFRIESGESLNVLLDRLNNP